MGKLIEFLIYLAGVVFLSWNYYKLKDAMDVLPFLIFVVFYLLGVSKFATFLAHKIDALMGNRLKRT